VAITSPSLLRKRASTSSGTLREGEALVAGWLVGGAGGECAGPYREGRLL
jgi:hypothetical protein